MVIGLLILAIYLLGTAVAYFMAAYVNDKYNQTFGIGSMFTSWAGCFVFLIIIAENFFDKFPKPTLKKK